MVILYHMVIISHNSFISLVLLRIEEMVKEVKKPQW